MAPLGEKKSFMTGALLLSGLFLSPSGRAQSQGEWRDSRPFLREGTRPASGQTLIFTRPLYEALTRSLMNPNQHQRMADLQAGTGGKSRQPGHRSHADHADHSASRPAKSSDVGRTMANFLGGEFKSTVLPDKLRAGLSFDFGSPETEAAEPARTPVRYGLIVKNVEPGVESFRFASVSMTTLDDYALVQYAPKARVHYEIGPLAPEEDLAHSAIPLAEKEDLGLLEHAPALQFRGRIAARGAPGAGGILPPQLLLLEQKQGFYALEVHTRGTLQKEALLHRLRVPLAGVMALREERDEKFRRTRSSLENIYARGPLALNLDYFGVERRYQTGLVYQKSLTRIEFYNHLPGNFSDQTDLWQMQRLELRVQTAF